MNSNQSILNQHQEELLEQNCLIALKELITECTDEWIQPDEKFLDDESLLIAIRCRNYDIPSAFEKMRRLVCAIRVKYPETFINFYPSQLATPLHLEGLGVLKQRDSKGRQLLYLRASSWDPEVVSFEDVCLALLLTGFEMLKLKETQLNGLIIIADLKDLTFKQARYVTPSSIQKYVDIILHSSPLKINGVHLMHLSRLFGLTLSLVKMFLPEKLNKIIYSHGSSFPSLHKHLGPELLPVSLGGLLEEADAQDIKFKEDLYTLEKEEWYKNRIAKIK